MLLRMETNPLHDRPPDRDTAAEWIARLAAELGVVPMSLRTQATVLSIARDVAHGTERKYAPLAAFVAGRAVELARREGRDVDSALGQVSLVVARLLGDPPATS